MIRLAGLWIVLYGLWLLLSGHPTPLFLAFGAGTCSAAVWLVARMRILDAESFPVHLAGRLAAYLPWLAWEILKSNVRIARVILGRRLEIEPRIVHFRASQRSDLGRFVHANSITLTPGTITTGIVGDDFEVHVLDAAHVDGSEESEMNRRVSALEGTA